MNITASQTALRSTKNSPLASKTPVHLPSNPGKTAWIFAGQGSQVAGMGYDIYQEFPQTQSIFSSTAAGFSLREICFNTLSNNSPAASQESQRMLQRAPPARTPL